MNSSADRPIYCASCGKWLGSAASPTNHAAPTHMLCPDCLSNRAGPAAGATWAERAARVEDPSPLVLVAGAATAAAAGLLALILRELRKSR